MSTNPTDTRIACIATVSDISILLESDTDSIVLDYSMLRHLPGGVHVAPDGKGLFRSNYLPANLSAFLDEQGGITLRIREPYSGGIPVTLYFTATGVYNPDHTVSRFDSCANVRAIVECENDGHDPIVEAIRQYRTYINGTIHGITVYTSQMPETL